MNTEKTIATISDLLSNSATEISQTCSTRNSVLTIYMGSGLPQLQLDLFKPILLENYAFITSYIVDEELLTLLQTEMEDIATNLELDPKQFQLTRAREYAQAPDRTDLYAQLCIHILRTRANAPSAKNLYDDEQEKLSSNTPLTLRLNAQRMREAAEATVKPI